MKKQISSQTSKSIALQTTGKRKIAVTKDNNNFSVSGNAPEAKRMAVGLDLHYPLSPCTEGLRATALVIN